MPEHFQPAVLLAQGLSKRFQEGVLDVTVLQGVDLRVERGIAFGVGAVRRALRFHPATIAGAGLLLSTLSGLASALFGAPFMTGLWVTPVIFGTEIPLATVMSFDIGVYLVVVGAIGAVALSLEEEEEDDA